MKTKISDVIVPAVFNPYFIKRAMELFAFWDSGIVTNDSDLDALATSGGRLINMPYWNDLTGEDEVLSDDGALTPAKITAGQDIAALYMRGKAWSVNDLAKALSGDDPMKAIGDLVAAYWARRYQALTFAQLKGVFANTDMATNSLDISAKTGSDALISGKAFIYGSQKLGDAKGSLTAIAMHSASETTLADRDLIEYVKDSSGKILYSTYMGKRLVVDDSCPYENDVFTSYLFAPGAIGLGNGAAPMPTETDRDSLAGDDILINCHHFVLHPRGIKFLDASVAGSSPTNAEAANKLNWERVYEPKAIRIVQIKHKVSV